MIISLISPGWSKLFMPTRRANSAALDINLTISRWISFAMD